MSALRRWAPSLAVFVAVQTAAALWVATELHVSRVVPAIARALAGPLNLLGRLDRLLAYGQWPRDALFLAMLAVILLLPWAHAWRPRLPWLVVSLLGSVLWVVAGLLFTVEHL